ncbi:gliding motility-associated C-terminal domain-containing protein [Flavobacterium sp. SM2513]|uniref:gliding motility-associated C-terminal domain-containing protein n=1 Tax=Flavobacterium sp. SM2513 TaxID=3424766 RepID=UPI003D7F8230
MKNILQYIFLQRKTSLLLIFMLFFGVSEVVAQCPSTAELSQSFCDTQGPTVGNLVATDNGGGIAWFNTATSTTPIPFGTGLINNKIYYLDNSTGNCGSRTAVTVSIYTAPTGLNFQGICVANQNEATIALLSAVGNEVQWYSTPFNGSPLSSTTVLTSGTIYYAGQTNPITGCFTSRLAVFVMVNIVTVPTGEPLQSFCNDIENPPTVNDLVASGANNWYLTNSSALVLAPTTPLVDGQTYYGTTVSAPCESAERLEVLVSLEPENEAGESADFTICATDLPSSPDINLFENVLGTPSNLGTWTGPVTTTNGNLGTLDISSLAEVGSPYVFTYTVTTSASCPPAVATVTITVEPLLDAGVDGTVTLCESDSIIDLFTTLGGTPDLGGTWSPSLGSGSGVFDPSVDLAGVYTYTLAAISCLPASATVTVSIIESLDPGISSSVTFCESDTTTNLFTILGGTPDLGGVWSPTLTSNTGVFDPSVDLAGVYTYTLIGTSPCPPVFSTVNVTVEPLLNAGIDNVVTFCENASPTDLFTVLGGNPETGGTWSPALASGTGVFDPSIDLAGSYTYTITSTSSCPSAAATITVSIIESLDEGISGAVTFCENASAVDLFTILGGTPDLGGIWSPMLASGTGIFDPSTDLSGVYTYTLIGTSPCLPVFSTVNVTVEPLLDAGIDNAVAFCESASVTDLFTLLGGSPDEGGIWSPALVSGTGVFDPSIDLAGSYTYTLTSTSSCPSDSATITVSILESLYAGISGEITFCESDLATDLFTILGGNPDIGGTWSPALTSGTGVFDPSVDLAGVYTYMVPGTANCPPDSSTVTVTINPLFDAGNDGNVTFCLNASSADLFTFLGGNPDTGGVWSPALASGTGVFNPLIDLPGIYTYTLTGFCPTDSATVTVAISPSLNAGTNGTITLCENAASLDLFTLLGGNPDLGGVWSPALTSGTGVFDPSIDAGGIYTYTLAGTLACPSDSAAVTVTVDALPTITLATIAVGAICLNSDWTIVLTDASNLSNGSYQLLYTISGAITFTNTISVVFTNGTASFIIPANVLNTVGTSTLTISPLQSNSGNSCGVSSHFFDAKSFTIDVVASPTFTGTNEFCEDDNATVGDLSSGIVEPQSIIWYNAPMNGTAYADTDVLIDGTSYYAVIVSPAGCESTTRLEVTVTVKNCDVTTIIIPDGFSPNGDGINDAFVIKNIRILYPNFTIEIYNRWGNVLFEGNATQPDWNGSSDKGIKIGGNEVPVGVYFFILNFNDGVKKEIQGRVYLSR